jgi:CDP-diacylglycerol--serine O-phosphatidyltransferase
MQKLILLFITVVLMTIFERILFIGLTSNEKGRRFIIRNRWLHPNLICIYRLPMGIVSCLIWMAGYPFFASIFFSFWMITDMTDGTIARG